MYVNGDVYTGKDNHAGQLGHISINYRGRPCSCGGRGCLERYVNIDAVRERIAEAAAFKRCQTLEKLTGGDMENLTVGMIAEAYERDDPVVVEAIDDVAEQLFAGAASATASISISDSSAVSLRCIAAIPPSPGGWFFRLDAERTPSVPVYIHFIIAFAATFVQRPPEILTKTASPLQRYTHRHNLTRISPQVVSKL